MKSFQELPLIDPLHRAIAETGYTTPTPIQARAIPPLLEGRDLLGCAQTGTGKTAAFALPILQHLADAPAGGKGRRPRAMVLTPTRELAAQIVESFRTYGAHTPLHTISVFGGVGRQPQVEAIRAGVDILVATPGRLLDLLGTRDVDMRGLEVFVLDEADRMLDMGFIHDVKRIIAALPERRQSLFFSATMPRPVAKLAHGLLTDPVRVEVVPQATPAERIRQSVLFVDKGRKDTLLADVLADPALERVLVFTRTKHKADRVAHKLGRKRIPAVAIHGNKAQNARTRALEAFRNGETRVLVATDIAARGIDIDEITHVINYELPNEPESYVHRIGRTARAGAEGAAISFCAGDELDYLQDIERLLGSAVPVDREHACHSDDAERGLVDGVSGAKVRKEKAAANQNRPRDRNGPDRHQGGPRGEGSRGGGRQRRSRAPRSGAKR